MRRLSTCLILLLAACSPEPSQNRYDSRDVGMNATVLFGTVISERQVQVTGENTGAGTLAGGLGGGVAGSLIGAGNGSVIGALAGAVGGAVLGNTLERDAGNRTGIEYVVALDNGVNQSIVQNIAAGDKPIALGGRVMLQMEGTYRRLLPAGPGAPPPPAIALPVPAPAAAYSPPAAPPVPAGR